MFLEIAPFDDASQKRLLSQLQNLGSQEKIIEFLVRMVEHLYEDREKQVGSDLMRQIEKAAYLSSIDQLWMDHLDNLDDLREGIGLRGYGQRDPLVEFKNEAFNLFDRLMLDIDGHLARRVFRIVPAGSMPRPVAMEQAQTNVDVSDMEGLAQAPITKAAVEQDKHLHEGQASKKLGRNDPCWCGKVDANGKPVKWKRCHYPQFGPS